MKVAIIGTGVSGLAGAHLLRDRVDLTLFEARRRPGGHANTVAVESERGLEAVDTGFIVFNERNYPEFTKLLQELEIPSRPSSMSFSVSDGSFEYTGRSLNGLFATRRNLIDPRFIRMLAEFPLFQREMRDLACSGDEGRCLDELLREGGYSRFLRERLVTPLVSAVWSAGAGSMGSFPAAFLARFLDNHGLLSLRGRPRWRTVEGGSWQYVDALTRPLRGRIRTSTPVGSVWRDGDRVRLVPAGGEAESFDHVVIATHSDQALSMLGDPSAKERRILGAMPFRENRAVLHTDRSLMPRRRAAWACWNYHLGLPGDGRPKLTYDMNRLQELGCDRRFFVSLNVEEEIDPGEVIEGFDYSHPVITPDSVRAQARWAEISGPRRTHYCGAWWRNGFHEDGVATGLRAARAVLDGLGQGDAGRSEEVPWQRV